MIWHALLILALLLASAHPSPADSKGPGGFLPCIPFVNGDTAGDAITPACPNLVLAPHAFPWQFDGTACDALGNGHLAKDGPFYGKLCAAKVVRCSPSSPNNYGDTKLIRGSPDVYVDYYTYETPILATDFCKPILGQFQDVTTRARFDTAQASVNGASSGDILHWNAPPKGIANWSMMAPAYVTTADLTIDLDPRFVASGKLVPSPPGQGALIVAARGFTINGGGSGTYNSGAVYENGSPVRIGSGAPNATIKNLVVHDCGDGWTGILSGNGNGIVTISNVTVERCGHDSSGNGQNHNVYVSANPTAQDHAATAQITNLFSLDVLTGGWSLKIRSLGISAPNRVTGSTLGCVTAIGDSLHKCQQNGVIDLPCGGNLTVDHSVLERGPAGDNSHVIRVEEEPPDGKNCPPQLTSNIVTLDHDIIIWDGPHGQGWNGVSVVCINHPDSSAGNCGYTATGSGIGVSNVTCTISNSVIVGDSASKVEPMLGRLCSDGGGNRWYADRTTAGAAEHWAPVDFRGTPCCAFPFLPPRMGDM